MPTVQGDYEIAEGPEEVKSLAEKHGIQFYRMYSRWEFGTTDKLINGKHGREYSIPTTGGVNSGETETQIAARWKGVSEVIPGLRCPYCQSQAFKTDHPSVAVCGAAPGWYMFYRKIDEHTNIKQKTKYVLKNGELVEVPDEEQETTKTLV